MIVTLVEMVKGLVSNIHGSERERKAANKRENAYKMRVSELLGVVERLKAEQALALTKLAKETEDRVSSALTSEWNDKLSAVEGTCQALTIELEHAQTQQDMAISRAHEETRQAVEQVEQSLRSEYSEKVNEMVIATAEFEILKDQNSTQLREWALTLDKVTTYLSTLQAKYDDLVAQKKLLSVFSVGLDALRDDVMFLALSCIDTANGQRKDTEDGLDETAVEFSPAVLHKLHRIGHSGGYLEHGYPTVTRANRSPSMTNGNHHNEGANDCDFNAITVQSLGQFAGSRRGRKYRIPTLRVVVIHVLGILRFKRILKYVKQRVKHSLFMRYEGYNELGPDGPNGASASAENVGVGPDPSGHMESAVRFALPSYSELCNLTPHQVAAFVLRSRRGEDVSHGSAYAAWSSPSKEEESDEDNGGGHKIPNGGLLAAITGQTLVGRDGDITDSVAYFDSILTGDVSTPGVSKTPFMTPAKDSKGAAKPTFLSQSPYTPYKNTTQPHHSVSSTLSMHDLTQGGTQHTRRNRFLWNSLPAYNDYFCGSQTAVLERALIYMAHQLKGLREEEEALRTTVHSLSEYKDGMKNELDESTSVMEQQKAKIAALDQQNKERERGLLKIALGHRRMAEVVASASRSEYTNGPGLGDSRNHHHEQHDYEGAHISAVNPAVLEEFVAAGRVKEAEDASIRRYAHLARTTAERESSLTIPSTKDK